MVLHRAGRGLLLREGITQSLCIFGVMSVSGCLWLVWGFIAVYGVLGYQKRRTTWYVGLRYSEVSLNHKPKTLCDYWVLGSARVAGLGSRLE